MPTPVWALRCPQIRLPRFITNSPAPSTGLSGDQLELNSMRKKIRPLLGSMADRAESQSQVLSPAARLNVPSGQGVVVQHVKPGSFADDIGLTRGDVILEINKQKVNNQDDFDRVQAGLKSGQDVVFLVRQRGAGRNDGTIFLAGTLP